MPKVFLPLVATGPRRRATVCNRAPKGPKQINLCTFNIGYDEGAQAGATTVLRVNVISQQVDFARDAEIVALQEVVHRPGARPELDMLRAQMKGWHAFSLPHNLAQDYRNMILSAYRIIRDSERAHVIRTERAPERTNLSVQVAHPSGAVRVFCIHTRAGAALEGVRQSLEWAAAVTASEPGVPFAIMGDFNALRKDVLAEARRAGLQVQATEAGRIDHMLLGGLRIDEECVVARPMPEGQHNPLFATVGRA
jgi:endonuclease/exonuclease/phosphatase family metal-dependent hydrolase